MEHWWNDSDRVKASAALSAEWPGTEPKLPHFQTSN